MNHLSNYYISLVIFVLFAISLSITLMILPLYLGKRKSTKNKLTPYECGFDQFDSPQKKLNIHFYLIALLFIIFDIEIAFLLPWVVSLKKIGQAGFISGMIFVFLLAVAFIYEWKSGALKWK